MSNQSMQNSTPTESNTSVTKYTSYPGMNMSMQDMMNSLDGKTDDDFDKIFISSMIRHHQGAINMARSAQENAGHQEIKDLADDIISAQTREIEMMMQWQKDWGFDQ